MEFVYKGLRADYARHLVTEEEVDRAIDALDAILKEDAR